MGSYSLCCGPSNLLCFSPTMSIESVHCNASVVGGEPPLRPGVGTVRRVREHDEAEEAQHNGHDRVDDK